MFFTDKKIAQLREQLERLQLAQEQQSHDFAVMNARLKKLELVQNAQGLASLEKVPRKARKGAK